MVDEFKNLIDGKWASAASGATFPSLNPANRLEVLGIFPRSDHRDVDRAAESARGHFDEWRLVPASRRAEILHRAGETIRAHEDEWCRLVTREMGKVLLEARVEVRQTVDRLASLAGEGLRLAGSSPPQEVPGRLDVCVRVPVGVVVAITPWNAPLAAPAAQVAFALVAGNTVVLKPAEETPLVATRLVEVLLEAGVPAGVLNLVHGIGEEAGAPLVRHPEVSLVVFAGSFAVGREVAIACAAEHKRTAVGVGAKGALIVMEDADLELALQGAIESAFATAGQRSTSVARVLVHRRILREFAERLVTRAGVLRLGDGLLPGTDVGPLVNEIRLKRVHAAARLALKEGARVLCGGEPFREGDCKRGFFYPPTVLGDVRPAMRIAQQDIPGPTVCLVAVDDLEEAVAVANRARFGLAASIYSRDVQRALLAVRELRAGRITVNASACEAEPPLLLPNEGQWVQGGWGEAGGGELFNAWKTIAVDYRGNLATDRGV